MTRIRVAVAAAALLTLQLATAAGALAQAARPFPVVPLPAAARYPHRAAWACLASGAALVGASFALAGEADRRYDAYLSASEPARIADLYDQTTRLDRLASGSLLAGEGLVVVGVYLRFIRRDPASRLHATLAPSRCAVSLSF